MTLAVYAVEIGIGIAALVALVRTLRQLLRSRPEEGGREGAGRGRVTVVPLPPPAKSDWRLR